MTSKTHVALGYFCSLAILYCYPNVNVYVTITGACIGSLIPDLDTPKSEPSKIFPLLAKIVDKLTRHRGDTHTMLPFLFIIMYYSFNFYSCLMLGLGSLSHLIIDRLTHKVGIYCNSKSETIIYDVLCSLNIAFTVMLCIRMIG